MELLALVLINIVFGVLLYYAVSIKVTNSVRDYQTEKMKKEIQSHILSFYKESENYLALMDSRIKVLKTLLQKAENMGIKFEEISLLPEDVKPSNTKTNDFQKAVKDDLFIPKKTAEPKVKESVLREQKEANNLAKESFFTDIVSGLGKGLKAMFGMNSMDEDPSQPLTTPHIAPKQENKNRNIDYSIGGDPFDEKKEIVVDNSKETEFEKELKSSQIQSKNPKDSIKISISAALREMEGNPTKVDKVVFLIKKGYSHAEISEELGLAIPEILLIETIKIERARRK